MPYVYSYLYVHGINNSIICMYVAIWYRGRHTHTHTHIQRHTQTRTHTHICMVAIYRAILEQKLRFEFLRYTIDVFPCMLCTGVFKQFGHITVRKFLYGSCLIA